VSRVDKNKTQGFTLVELLVVMLVLVALSSITLDFTKDFAFQGRYEVTKDRYDKIKRAIIGRPDVLINGQPDISGFVADMGRLPNNIRELLDADYCLPDRRIDDDGINFDTGTYATAILDCNTTYVAGSWIVQNNWNGPYLTSTKGVTEENAFSDGWGSVPTAYCTDLNFTTSVACAGAGDTWVTAIQNHNYGWYYFVDTSGAIDELHLFSLGKDQVFNGSNYDADYPNSVNHPNEPPVINGSGWLVQLPQITISMQSPMTNAFNCTANNFTQSACTTTINWSWLGAPECRDFSDNIVSGNTKAVCTATPSNDWYWITNWSIAFCEDNTKITEATCTVGSVWHNSLCSGGDSTGNEISLDECLSASPAAGTWSGVWPVADARCTNRNFTTQALCEGANHFWLEPFCSDLTSATQTACTTAVEDWVVSFCSNGNQVSEVACSTANGLWGGCFGQTNSKYFCDINGGNWVTNTQDVEVEIAYGAGGASVATAIARVEENGLNQNVVFNDDNDADGVVFFIDAGNDGVEDAGDTDVTGIPQGVTTLSVFKLGTSDIYPPSCSGLTAAQCTGATGVILNNNLCDNVTALECTTAGGQLLRSPQDILSVPNKIVPIIKW